MISHSHLTMLVLFFTFLFTPLPTGTQDLTSDRSALLALRSAVGGRTFLWNTAQQTPCQWAGVQCHNNHVTALRLPGVSLSGQLPSGTVGNLTDLQTLSLRFNALFGPLPSGLSNCKQLRNLYLQGNHFSSPLPEFLFGVQRFVHLNLAGNNFSGKISTRFSNLTWLRTLYLENNQLTGSIPDLKLLNLMQFNVSFNQLNEYVLVSLMSMSVDSFLGNVMCGKPLKSCPTDAAITGIGEVGNNNKKKKWLSGGAIAGIVIGSILGLLLVLLLLFILCRKKTSKKTRSVDSQST